MSYCLHDLLSSWLMECCLYIYKCYCFSHTVFVTIPLRKVRPPIPFTHTLHPPLYNYAEVRTSAIWMDTAIPALIDLEPVKVDLLKLSSLQTKFWYPLRQANGNLMTCSRLGLFSVCYMLKLLMLKSYSLQCWWVSNQSVQQNTRFNHTSMIVRKLSETIFCLKSG